MLVCLLLPLVVCCGCRLFVFLAFWPPCCPIVATAKSHFDRWTGRHHGEGVGRTSVCALGWVGGFPLFCVPPKLCFSRPFWSQLFSWPSPQPEAAGSETNSPPFVPVCKKNQLSVLHSRACALMCGCGEHLFVLTVCLFTWIGSMR